MQIRLIQLFAILGLAAIVLASVTARSLSGSMLWTGFMAALAVGFRVSFVPSRGFVDIVLRELRVLGAASCWGLVLGLALDVPFYLVQHWPHDPGFMISGGISFLLGCQLVWPENFHIHPAISLS